MKKSLFALAALGAIAGTAQAQSSVTVYGVIDEGFVSSNVRLANAPNGANNGVPAGGVVNSTNSAIASGAESTGRLGFKGNEDIGGGLSAFFTYEMKLDPNQATLPAATQDTDRQAFVGLKKSGVGQFALGTQYTPIFNAVAATDPGMTNNMMGNVIYDKVSGNTSPALQVSASQANANTYVPPPAAYQYSGMQNNTSFTVRASNMISVATDTFAGFQGNAMYVMKNQNTNSQSTAAGTTGYANGTTNSTAWGLGVNYTWNKLLVTANYQNFTDKSAYTLAANGTGMNTVQNGYGGQNGAGTNDRDNQQYYAATYDFGILKAYVQYVNRKTMDVINSANYIARTAQQIGVRSFITPTVEAWASTGTGKLTVGNSGGTTGQLATNNMAPNAILGSNAANFGGFQLGSNYWLSKRTNLYAIYGQERTSNQNFVLNANPTSYNMSSYAVGVRHTF
jgi:predicted porin